MFPHTLSLSSVSLRLLFIPTCPPNPSLPAVKDSDPDVKHQRESLSLMFDINFFSLHLQSPNPGLLLERPRVGRRDAEPSQTSGPWDVVGGVVSRHEGGGGAGDPPRLRCHPRTPHPTLTLWSTSL